MIRHDKPLVLALVLAACLTLAGAAPPVGGVADAAAGPQTAGSQAEAIALDAGPRAADRVAVSTPDTPDGEAASDGPNTTTERSSDGATPTVGESFAGAIAVHDAELSGELRTRTFDRRLDAAATPASRAALLAGTARDARLRLGLLTDRRTALREANRNGTLSDARFRVAMAELRAEARSLRGVIDRAAGPMTDLDPMVRADYGLENSTFADLAARADRLGSRNGSRYETTLDSEPVFDPAEGLSSAWDDTRRRVADHGTLDRDMSTYDGIDWSGTDADANETRTAVDDTTTDDSLDSERRMTLLALEGNVSRLDGVHGHLAERADGDADAERHLACARDALDTATAALADAERAIEDAAPDRADARFAEARDALDRARNCLTEARAALQDDDGGDDGGDGTTATPTAWKG
jgi:hypothetical protein